MREREYVDAEHIGLLTAMLSISQHVMPSYLYGDSEAMFRRAVGELQDVLERQREAIGIDPESDETISEERER